MQPLSELLSLQGKTTLITGGAAGIGKSIAQRYAEAGSALILIDRDQKTLNSTKQELENKYKVTVEPVVLDLLDIDAIHDFWSNLQTTPDILVNNAGIFAQKALEDIKDSDYDRMLTINTKAVFLMCQQMIKARGAKNPGNIINISSIEARAAMTSKMTLYGMSKAALLGLTRSLTEEYSQYGWRINSVLPGGITTPGSQKMGLAALKRLDFSIIKTGMQFNSRLPYPRMGQSDDIARTVLFLGTPASDYICGTEIVIDGGFLAV